MAEKRVDGRVFAPMFNSVPADTTEDPPAIRALKDIFRHSAASFGVVANHVSLIAEPADR